MVATARSNRAPTPPTGGATAVPAGVRRTPPVARPRPERRPRSRRRRSGRPRRARPGRRTPASRSSHRTTPRLPGAGTATDARSSRLQKLVKVPSLRLISTGSASTSSTRGCSVVVGSSSASTPSNSSAAKCLAVTRTPVSRTNSCAACFADPRRSPRPSVQRRSGVRGHELSYRVESFRDQGAVVEQARGCEQRGDVHSHDVETGILGLCHGRRETAAVALGEHVQLVLDRTPIRGRSGPRTRRRPARPDCGDRRRRGRS